MIGTEGVHLNEDMIILYHYSLCPWSRSVRIAMVEHGLKFSLQEEYFWERREVFLAFNPSGHLPVMILANGKTVMGRYPCLEYIEEEAAVMNKAFTLMPSEISERAIARYLVEWFSVKFYDEVTQYLLKEKMIKVIVASQSAPDSNAIRAAKKNVVYHFDYISYLLENSGGPYLCGEYITLADCAAAAQISVIDFTGDVPWTRSTKVKVWYALMKSRPSMRSVLSDRIPNMRAPAHYSNPDF